MGLKLQDPLTLSPKESPLQIWFNSILQLKRTDIRTDGGQRRANHPFLISKCGRTHQNDLSFELAALIIPTTGHRMSLLLVAIISTATVGGERDDTFLG